MPDRETTPDHGWTMETLRIYIDSRVARIDALLVAAAELSRLRFENQDRAVLAAMAAQEKAVAAALAAAERAVVKSEVAAEKRFDAVNEFRGQLADQAQTLMPRSEAEQRIATNTEKINSLAARLDKGEGRSTGMNAGWVLLASAIGVISTIIAIYIGLSR
jgi:hypothetical protein